MPFWGKVLWVESSSRSAPAGWVGWRRREADAGWRPVFQRAAGKKGCGGGRRRSPERRPGHRSTSLAAETLPWEIGLSGSTIRALRLSLPSVQWHFAIGPQFLRPRPPRLPPVVVISHCFDQLGGGDWPYVRVRATLTCISKLSFIFAASTRSRMRCSDRARPTSPPWPRGALHHHCDDILRMIKWRENTQNHATFFLRGHGSVAWPQCRFFSSHHKRPFKRALPTGSSIFVKQLSKGPFAAQGQFCQVRFPDVSPFALRGRLRHCGRCHARPATGREPSWFKTSDPPTVG